MHVAGVDSDSIGDEGGFFASAINSDTQCMDRFVDSMSSAGESSQQCSCEYTESERL